MDQNMHDFCFAIIWDRRPHHDTTSTVAIHFLNTGGRETFIPAPVYPYSAISFLQDRMTSMCYHGLPNRRIWIRLNTFGTIWINVCASVNLHLRPSINSAKCCNSNGEQYHEIMLENWLSLCRGGVERCWPRVVIIHGTNFKVTGSVLNWLSYTNHWRMDCKFFYINVNVYFLIFVCGTFSNTTLCKKKEKRMRRFRYFNTCTLNPY
jgi:hypothetical protein